MANITAHCLVKNEEKFIRFVIESVIVAVDVILVYDTGSTDSTVAVIRGLMSAYPGKIILEEKGVCDRKRHTHLRNEMISKTTTEWFMVLDGDEVWTDRSLFEVHDIIAHQPQIECLITCFYLCVGDVRHYHYRSGQVEMLGRREHFYPRFFKKVNGIYWQGQYNEDTVVTHSGAVFFNKQNTAIMFHKYWHLTHLIRSSVTNDFTSGGTRGNKVIPTYFIIGRKIKELLPEVFMDQNEIPELSGVKSFFNFFLWSIKKVIIQFFPTPPQP